jgi:hypothetical protein
MPTATCGWPDDVPSMQALPECAAGHQGWQSCEIKQTLCWHQLQCCKGASSAYCPSVGTNIPICFWVLKSSLGADQLVVAGLREIELHKQDTAEV